MKKVLMMLAMVSMVAMMAACNNSGKDDDDDDNPIEAKAKKFAKERCKCGDDYKCINDVEDEVEEYLEDLEKKERKEFKKIYRDALEKCSEDGDYDYKDEEKRDDDDYSYEKRDYDYYGSPAAQGERLGEEVCNCMQMMQNGDMEAYEECMKPVIEEYERIISSFNGDEQKQREFDEAGQKVTNNCMNY